MQAESWSRQNGIDLDRMLDLFRRDIERDRRKTRKDYYAEMLRQSDKPRIRRVYELVWKQWETGGPTSTYQVADMLHLPHGAVYYDYDQLRKRGLIEKIFKGKKPVFKPTSVEPDWELIVNE